MKRRPAQRINVRAGQCYRAPRPGRPARHVRIVRVTGKSGPQPIAHYVEVTRTGRPKSRLVIRSFLQWKGRYWGMGPGFEEVSA